MKATLKFLAVLVAAVWLLGKWIESNPTSQMLNTYIEPGIYQRNDSQAALQYAQAEQVRQQIRIEDEKNNGLGMNMVARILAGKGITDFEQAASTVVACLIGLALGPGVVVAVIVLLGRKTQSKTEEV